MCYGIHEIGIGGQLGGSRGPSGPVGYKVKQGDTLSNIAKQCGCSIAELKRLNPNINPDKINVNQVIQLPKTKKGANVGVNTGSNDDKMKKNWTIFDQHKLNTINNQIREILIKIK